MLEEWGQISNSMRNAQEYVTLLGLRTHCINTAIRIVKEKIINYRADIEKHNAFSVTLMHFCACVRLQKFNTQPCEHGGRLSVEMASQRENIPHRKSLKVSVPRQTRKKFLSVDMNVNSYQEA